VLWQPYLSSKGVGRRGANPITRETTEVLLERELLIYGFKFYIPSLKPTYLPKKMDHWNTTFLLGRPIFRGELLVSGSVSFEN